MFSSLRKPARLAMFFALAALLVLAFALLSCSEKQPTANAPGGTLAFTPANLAKVIAVQDRHTSDLMKLNGVVGTATGISATGGLAVKVFAARADVAGIPASLDGIPVEVDVTGEFTAFALSGRYRPVPTGVSVGNNNECAAGTIGCVVYKGTTAYILSNNHVLARENAASLGEIIVQPGRYDSQPQCADQSSTNTVATLSQFVPINFSGGNNTVDCALAQYTAGTAFTCSTPSGYYGFPSATTVNATVGLGIKKVGRTSTLTTGTVTAINATVNVGYSSGTATFVGQIVTSRRFSKAGDSGSLVVTNNASNNPVGLLFAGTKDGTTILNPINSVLSALGNPTICSQ